MKYRMYEILFLALAIIGFSFSPTLACQKLPRTDQPILHIIAVDQSGSFETELERTKEMLISCYMNGFVRNGDELVLIGFAYDNSAEARIIGRFRFSEDNARFRNAVRQIENGGKNSVTYFVPVVELIERQLHGSRLPPVQLVFSDGISDVNSRGRKKKPLPDHIKGSDVKLQAFGNVFSHHRRSRNNRFRLAVRVSNEIGISAEKLAKALFASHRRISNALPSIASCWFDPRIKVETSVLELKQTLFFNPMARSGSVHFTASLDCASRERSYELALLRAGGGKTVLASGRARFDRRPKQIELAVSLTDGLKDGDRVILKVGGKSVDVPVQQVDLIEAYRTHLAIAGGSVVFLLLALLTWLFMRSRRAIFIQVTTTGETAQLRNGVSVSLGGLRTNLPVTEEDVGALAILTAQGRKLSIKPQHDVSLEIDGVPQIIPANSSAGFELGQEITLVHDGMETVFRLLPAKKDEVSLLSGSSSADDMGGGVDDLFGDDKDEAVLI